MLRSVGRAAALAAVTSLACASACEAAGINARRESTDTPASGPPMTFAEVMAEERNLGVARVSPDGGQVLVSVERHDRPTEGVPWKVTATSAFVWSRATGVARPILRADAAFLPALCEPWSPSGRFVAGLVVRDGQRWLAVWTTATESVRIFAAPPLTMCPTWVGDRLVYPAPAENDVDRASAAPAAARLVARWRAAWTQDTVQVTVHSNNPDFPAPEAPPGRLMIADPITGAEAVLATGEFHSVTPDPTGARLAAVRSGARDPDALSRQSGRIGELEVFRLDDGVTGPVATVEGFDVDYGGLAWSPDGQRLLAGGRDPAAGQLGFVVLDRDGAELERFAPPPTVVLGHGPRGAYSTLRPLGWIGGRPAFIAAAAGAAPPPAGGQSDYGEGRGLRFGLYIASASGVHCLSCALGGSVTAFASDAAGRGVVAADGVLWNLSTRGEARRLSPRTLVVDGLAQRRPSYGLPPSLALTEDTVAVRARRGDRAVIATLSLRSGAMLRAWPAEAVAALDPDLRAPVLRATSGWATRLRVAGDARAVATLNPDWTGRAVGQAIRFDYTAAGRALTGWIVLPPDYRGGRLPAVVWLYGGQLQGATPPAEARPGRLPTPLFSGQLWAAEGYAVIYPSTPLGAGAETDVPSTLAAHTEAAVRAAAARGWIDPARVGLIGHSFGGFSVAAVLARSGAFRAGVALSGPYDFVAAWGARQPLEGLTDAADYPFVEETLGFVEAGQIALKAPPYADPAAYLRSSPLFAAPRIETPLLLMAGDLDQGATSLMQAERLYAALRRSGRPAAMVRYWGQDHVQDDPWAVRDQWARATAWFARYLGPGPSRASATTFSGSRQAPRSPGPGPASSGPTTRSSPPS